MKTIDINCDMGESYGQFTVGNDQSIFPHITSCNIACGFHGGDPLHIERTIQQAIENDVQIGAHPSYPDLLGFGRRPMQLPANELTAILKYQIAALKGMTESNGGKLVYVKPHGALYNAAADDEKQALALITAIKAIDTQLALMGLAGSPMEELAGKHDIKFIREAFADRKYDELGRLMSRSKQGAVISSPDESAAQVMSIVLGEKIIADKGIEVAVKADSICIHGDNPAAVDILKAIHKKAEEKNISIKKHSL